MVDSTCSVEGCDSAIYVKKKQLCRPHYNRLHYSGSVELPKRHTACVECGAPTRAAKSVGTKPKYCSNKCRTLVNQRKYIESGKYDDLLARRRNTNAAKPLPVHICLQCGGSFESTHRRSKFCSPKCSNKHTDANNPKRCTEPDCDRGVRAKGMCSMHWRRKARADGREANPAWTESRKASYHKRRAQKIGTQVEDLRPIDIYERDIWLCGLCVTPVDPDCAWPDPMSPSLDHVLPLSKGGTHTYENVQLAHLTCNVSKGNRIAA
jgi:hypothetical protein